MTTQAPQAVQRVSVYRPVEYSSLPQWSPEVTESALNRYRISVDAQSFDENRIAFSLRSPGLGVVASNNLFITASFEIETPGRWDFPASSGPICQICLRLTGKTLNDGLQIR